MKLLILSILTIFSFGQIISQNTDAVLFFNDGTSIEGYGEIYKTDKIKFRISLDEEPDIWTDLMVKKIVFYGFETSALFQYVRLKPNGSVKLLEVLVDEETKLFADVITYSNYSNNGLQFNGLPTIIYNEKLTISKLYVQKAEDKFPFALTGNFRRKSKEYFSDCEVLVKKISSGEFRKSTVNDMIYYYNDYCGE